MFMAVLQKYFEDLKWDNEGIKIGNHYLSHLWIKDDIESSLLKAAEKWKQ